MPIPILTTRPFCIYGYLTGGFLGGVTFAQRERNAVSTRVVAIFVHLGFVGIGFYIRVPA